MLSSQASTASLPVKHAPTLPVIISDRHRYLFVELPRTGSTAVHRELKARYDGTPILTKHATYRDFLKVATENQKRYFVFSSVRNPLDDAVPLHGAMGYRLPVSWGISGPTMMDRLGYRVYSFFACLYWRYLRSGT